MNTDIIKKNSLHPALVTHRLTEKMSRENALCLKTLLDLTAFVEAGCSLAKAPFSRNVKAMKQILALGRAEESLQKFFGKSSQKNFLETLVNRAHTLASLTLLPASLLYNFVSAAKDTSPALHHTYTLMKKPLFYTLPILTVLGICKSGYSFHYLLKALREPEETPQDIYKKSIWYHNRVLALCEGAKISLKTLMLACPSCQAVVKPLSHCTTLLRIPLNTSKSYQQQKYLEILEKEKTLQTLSAMVRPLAESSLNQAS